MNIEVEWMILGLLNLWAITGENPRRAITKEDLLKHGKELPRLILPLISEAEFAEGLGNTPYIQRIWEEGQARGLVQGLHSAIELGLELKFGAAGLALLPEIEQIAALDLLKTIHQALKTATPLAEIRQIYQPHVK